MSTELPTEMTTHTATEFWGGDSRGVCLQVMSSLPMVIRDSVEEQVQEEGFIQVTLEEAAALYNTLGVFIANEAKRRQVLLQEEIARLKLNERTVFHEVAELDRSLIAGPTVTVTLISNLCPKAPREK